MTVKKVQIFFYTGKKQIVKNIDYGKKCTVDINIDSGNNRSWKKYRDSGKKYIEKKDGGKK